MLTRTARIEAIRLLRDPTLAACLGLSLLPAIALVASIPSGATEPGISRLLEGPMRMTLIANVAIITASFGAVRTAAAFRSGVVGRDALVLHAGPPFWLRVLTSALGGAAIAAAAWGSAVIGTRAISGLDVFHLDSLASAAAIGAGAGAWGTAVGALVRSPLAALPVTILSLSPAMFLSSLVPKVAAWLPLSAALHAVNSPIGETPISREWSAALALFWVAFALSVAFVMLKRRPLLS